MRIGLLLVLAAGLAACGGGGSSSGAAIAPVATGSATPTPAPLGVAPATLAVNDSAPSQVLVTGLVGPLTITIADRSTVDVSVPVVTGSSAAFTVSAWAGGSTSIAVADGRSSVTIPVTTQICVPPGPKYALLGENVVLATPPPAPGSPILPVVYTTLFFDAPASDESALPQFAAAHSVRLIGSNGTSMTGGYLTAIASLSSVTPATPPAAPAGTVEWYSVVDPLQHGVTYRAQIVGERCEPPFIAGSFSA
jgi:hypothetical protein